MYPFFVLDLPHDCTDQDVEDRYHALLLRFPPDVAPDQFTLIRAAYEALRDERQRLSTRLFYHDDDTQIVDSMGLPIGRVYDLRYARRPAGGAWTAETIDERGDVGRHACVATTEDGFVYVVYLDDTDDDLRVMRRCP